MCARRQTSNIEVCAIRQVRKDGAMPQTVLLIYDDGAKATLVKDALVNSSEGFFTIEWVERCSEAARRLRRDGKERIAAILVNLFLPDCQGIETFDRIFQISPDVPILVLSSLEHENAAKLAVQRGAPAWRCRPGGGPVRPSARRTCPRRLETARSARRSGRPTRN